MAEHATRAPDTRARRNEPAPARPAGLEGALESRAPVRAEAAYVRLLGSRPPGPSPMQRKGAPGDKVVQLKLVKKGDKIGGAAAAVKLEVTATIARNRPQEMLDDIAALDASIALRTQEQASFNPKTNPAAYKSHADRIAMEKKQRKKLQDAYDADKAVRDQAKAAAAAAAPAAAPPPGFSFQKRKK